MEKICLTEEEKEKAISIARKRVMVNVFALALIIVISCIIGVFGFSVRLLVVYVFWGFIGAVIGYGLLQNINEMKEVKVKLADNTLTAYRAVINDKSGSRSTYYAMINKGNMRVYISMGEYFSAKPGEYVHFVKMGERYYSVGIYKNQELDE